ncbi:MAG: hemerythrin domain-containing protein [Bacteriovoracaceae bacterium]
MDIYHLLKEDHLEIQQILNELISLRDDDEYRYILIEEIKNLLIPHSRAEESVFYNTLRAIDTDTGIIMHGFREHLEAETLLRTLQLMERVNLNWKSTAKKLKQVLDHHIDSEENEIFEEAKLAFSQDEALSIGEAFEKLKNKIAEEGAVKNTMDILVNMLPPRLTNGLRKFGEDHSSI